MEHGIYMRPPAAGNADLHPKSPQSFCAKILHPARLLASAARKATVASAISLFFNTSS
jgi:hypothetical protein